MDKDEWSNALMKLANEEQNIEKSTTSRNRQTITNGHDGTSVKASQESFTPGLGDDYDVGKRHNKMNGHLDESSARQITRGGNNNNTQCSQVTDDRNKSIMHEQININNDKSDLMHNGRSVDMETEVNAVAKRRAWKMNEKQKVESNPSADMSSMDSKMTSCEDDSDFGHNVIGIMGVSAENEATEGTKVKDKEFDIDSTDAKEANNTTPGNSLDSTDGLMLRQCAMKSFDFDDVREVMFVDGSHNPLKFIPNFHSVKYSRIPEDSDNDIKDTKTLQTEDKENDIPNTNISRDKDKSNGNGYTKHDESEDKENDFGGTRNHGVKDTDNGIAVIREVSNESAESFDTDISSADDERKLIGNLRHTYPTPHTLASKIRLTRLSAPSPLQRSFSEETRQEQKKRFLHVLEEIKERRSDDELDEETKWIRNRLKCRECATFVPADPEKGISPGHVLCQCGHVYDNHSSSAKKAYNQNHANTKWHYKHHSKQLMTNAFGEMEFVGYGGKVGKYVRVDVDTKMSDMLELMMKVWGMDKPNLLISVTGGAKNFKMNKRLKETFRRGLMKTALTTGAWIITGGTHAGVMKHVGEAVKDFDLASSAQNPVVTIGIAPWGCVQNRHALINRECLGLWPAHYRIQKEVNPKESFLDPNHSHFILVDNATERKFAVEIPFRAKLEYEIAKIQTDTDGVLVPIVLLVLEGGIGTLETVHEAIQKNTPAVIVKGSGRAADILAFAYQNAKEEEIEAKDQEGNTHRRTRRCMEDPLSVQVKEMVEKEFGPNKIVTHMNWIKDCLDKSDLVSVFELDNKTGSKEIDVSMLQALLKANKNHVMDQLRLALAWNRIDVAKNDIFTDDKRWPTGSLDELMLSAIQLNRTDFVELFMDHGVSLREFLTKKRLLVLYNKIPKNNCLLRTLLNKVKGKTKGLRRNFSLLDVGMLMQELLGDYFQYIYTTEDDYAYLDVDNILDGLTLKSAQEGGIAGLKAVTKIATTIAQPSDAKRRGSIGGILVDFENPAQELFIWSVLMIRQDMAKIFWAEGKDAIAGALVANSLLRAMKARTEDTELAIKMQEYIDEWSNLAIGVLNECHSTDEKKAQDLLVRELGNWGDATCMLIAVKADNKEFISQTACQLLLNSIWMGKMTQENHALKLLLCTLFPPLAVWLVRFQLSADTKDVQIDLPDQKEENSRPGTVRRQPTFNRGKTMLAASTRNSRTSLRFEEDVKDQKEDDQPKIKMHMYSIRDRFYYFFNAPVIIFLYNVVSYLVFLALFTYILLFDFNPKVSNAEIVLMVWVFTIFTEEIRQIMKDLLSGGRRQVAMTSSSTLKTKLQSYITDTWNVVDLITIGLFIVGTILRFIPDPDTFEAARLFLALNFFTFFLRLLHIFSVHKELGPKLVMIGRMVQDLMYFVLILMVFVVSYAIASHSILFPNSPLNWKTINTVMRRSYWNIYGELFLEEIEGEDDCTYDEALWINNTYSRCPSDMGRYAVPIMMGVYMLLANVLLLNLLIAMFSYTFQKIQDNTDKHWFYQRYSLIYEYYTRPVLCPPFIVIAHIYLLVRYIIRQCCCGCCQEKDDEDDEDDFRRHFKNERELVQWENVIADAFHHKSEQKQFQSTEYKVSNTHDRLELIVNRVDEIQELINQQTTPMLNALSAPQSTTTRIEMLELIVNRVDEIQELINQQTTPMLNALSAPQSTTTRIEVQPQQIHEVKLPPQLDKRLTSLEQQMEVTSRSLDWIMKAMQANNMVPGSLQPPAMIDLEQQKHKEIEMMLQKKETDRLMVQQIVEQGLKVHTRSRTSPYQGSEVIRFTVPDELVEWEKPFPDYSPVEYTSEEVLAGPIWADPDIMNLFPIQRMRTISSYNSIDKEHNCNRISYCGTYMVRDGLPLNPEGRTGLVGRGLLGRWGPNHAGDPVVTRWKMDGDGKPEIKNGKRVLEFVAIMRLDNQMFIWKMDGDGKPEIKNGKQVLEFVAIMRLDNQMWALPGTIMPPGSRPADLLEYEFTDEVLMTYDKRSKDAKSFKKKLKKLWKKGVMIYEGYADDPRNTDNAWLETTVYNYHDHDGTILRHFNLRAGDSVELATWLTASSSVTMHGSHLYFLKLVAEKLGAYF